MVMRHDCCSGRSAHRRVDDTPRLRQGHFRRVKEALRVQYKNKQRGEHGSEYKNRDDKSRNGMLILNLYYVLFHSYGFF